MAIDAPTAENERPTKFELPSSAYRSGLETVCICLSILFLIARHQCFRFSIELAEVCLIPEMLWEYIPSTSSSCLLVFAMPSVLLNYTYVLWYHIWER